MRKSKKYSTIILLSILGIGAIASIGALIGISISDKNSSKIYFANFESYISPELKQSLTSENNVSYKTYGTSEELESRFSENYDIAIPTSYTLVNMIKRNEVKKIDWSKFNITGINNSTDALNLFTDPVKKVLSETYDLNNDGTYDNLLDYGIPYFLQDVVLGFKQNKKTNELFNLKSWSELFNWLELNQSNVNGEIISVKDERTLYGISRLRNNKDSVNPENNVKSIDDFYSDYKYLKKFGNHMIFRTDSGEVLNSIASPNGAKYSILYNGDLVYSMLGGDMYYDNPDNSLNFIRPSNTLIMLDMVTINKNTKANQEQIYNILKKVCLNEDDWTLTNFEYVNYTPPLKDIYDKVTDINYELWNDQVNANKIVDLLKIDSSSLNILNLVEKPISDIQKESMQIAFLKALN